MPVALGIAGARSGLPWPRSLTCGAADACVAGLLMGLARGLDWPDTVRLARPVSAAAVARPVTGEADPVLARQLHAGVSVDRECH